MKRFALGGVLAAALLSGFKAVPAGASCASPANPIEAENCLAGNPPSQWDIPYSTSGSPSAGDPTIQGFATDISYNKGDTAAFKINTDAAAYAITIYRMGYYGGMGARQVATATPVPLPLQPACLSDAATGLIDCGNWSASASWTIPSNAVSGIYFAKLVRSDTGGSSHIVFIVRDDSSSSKLLFQTSDTTWEAYNQYGGKSLYSGFSSVNGGAYKVSYNRPFSNRNYTDNWVFTHEYPMVRFLEANGYDVSYFTGMDGDRRGTLIKNHKVFLSVGHDEYWSGAQRANVEAARAAGVHLAFFSGNATYWKTRWENSTDLSAAPFRTLVCYKETYNGNIDPLDPPTWTGLWRDFANSPPADGGRPENALKGTLSTVGAYRQDALTVGDQDGKLRFWRNTSAAGLAPGQSVSFPNVVGYEWDEDIDNGFRPPGLMTLSSSTYAVAGRQVGPPSMTQYLPGAATHHLTLFKQAGGALVFSAGTMQWSWGLDSNHDQGAGTPTDVPVQQATVNLLADMGAQPATLLPALSPASASSDTVPPVSTVTFPAAGAGVAAGSTVTVTGTATDLGGIVAAVEVSVDSGTSWHPAAGRSSWTYAWLVPASGSFTIKSRAVDDSGNLETPTSGVMVGVPAPVPTLLSLAPSSAPAGGPSFTLTANGANFTANSVVLWNGAARPTTFVSGSTLTAAISASDIPVPGSAAVTVKTPAPGGGTSSPATFSIVNPMPVLSGLSPSSAAPGGSSFTLTATGANFEPNSTVLWNGFALTTTYVSSSTLTAAVPAAAIANPGSDSVTVASPSPGGGTSAPAAFSVPYPAPTLATISPSSGTAGGSGFTMTVTGTNYAPGSVVQWNGAGQATTYVSGQTLTAAITAGELAAPGADAVTVFNPSPGGGTSSSATFTAASPAPTLAGISPSTAAAGGPGFTLTANGSNLEPASVVLWNGAARPTTFVSSGTLTAAIPASDIASPSTAAVTVNTPAPGGGTSASATFTAQFTPSISALSPSSTTAGGPAFTLTVNGASFVSGSVVQWNGANRTTTFVSSAALTAAIPAGDVAAPGTAQVTVSNPGSLGGTSAPAPFTVSPPPGPLISALSPSTAAAGGPAFTLTISGSHFASNDAARWNGAALTTSFVSSTTLTAAVPASDVAASTIAQVTVSVPGPGGSTSGAAAFTVYDPAPSITTLSPASATAGGPAFTLTVTGSGFAANDVVRWNGSDRATTFVSNGTLTAAIPASDLASPGTASVAVFAPAPGGGTSSAAPFMITSGNPVPRLAAISPNSSATGAPSFTITATGSNFVAGSALQWNGSTRATTVVSSATLTASIPAGDVAAAGTSVVTIFNPSPGGGTSNGLTFTVGMDTGGKVRVYPNPLNAAGRGASANFAGLPPNASIKLFTISGRWVKTVPAPGGTGTWDLTNSVGEPVSSGIYIYLVTDGQGGKTRGTLALVR